MNPYTHQDFFSFFSILFHRLWDFFVGHATPNLFSDEVQILVLIGISVSGGIVGSFLILRKMTMVANALSHTMLLGIVLVYLLMRWMTDQEALFQSLSIPALLIAALTAGLLTVVVNEFLIHRMKVPEDASIGLVFTTLFALGIIFITLFTKNGHLGTELITGNIDGVSARDLFLVFCVMGINLLVFGLFFRGFKITTFDPQLGRVLGISPLIFNYLLMVQASITTISGFRAVGVLMILAFLVIPPLTARLFSHTLWKLITLAIVLGVVTSMMGIALSRHIFTYFGVGVSTAGLVVVLLGLLYLASLLLHKTKEKITGFFRS